MAQPDEGTRESQETRVLLAWLREQRRHVLGALEGLPDDALRRPVLPSGWTCLGLVQHLALDVERFWFRAVVAGEAVDLASGDAAWQVGPEVAAEAVLAGTGRRRRWPMPSSPPLPSTPHRPGGRRRWLATSRPGSCERRSCTSSPRPPVTPATSTWWAKLIDGRSWLVLTG